jgi:hypothetical protein
MSRVPQAFRESTLKQQQVHPIWRGIGLILIVLLTVGTFWLAGYALDNNLWGLPLPFPIPTGFTVTIVSWLPTLPGKPLVQIAAAALIDVFAYAVIVVVWSVLHPMRLGPKDAKQPRGHKRPRSMVR